MNVLIMNIERLELATSGMGFHVVDQKGNRVGAYFKDQDPVKGLELLDTLRDELQAVVMDKLLAESPLPKKVSDLATAEEIDAIADEVYGNG